MTHHHPLGGGQCCLAERSEASRSPGRDPSLRLRVTGLFSCRALTYARYKRRILTPKKHAHNKSIAVLKNTEQNERYVSAIQSFIEKESNSAEIYLGTPTPDAFHGCHPEPRLRVCRAGQRDASLRLSMTL